MLGDDDDDEDEAAADDDVLGSVTISVGVARCWTVAGLTVFFLCTYGHRETVHPSLLSKLGHKNS